MLRDADLDELEQGQTVHLYPHTKTASRACHEQRTVKLMHDKEGNKKHWPFLVVEWKEGGVDCWARVHKDDVKLKASATTTTKEEKRQGDQTGTRGKAPRVRVLPKQPKANVELAENEEQGTLW